LNEREYPKKENAVREYSKKESAENERKIAHAYVVEE
jgi:hypothetical protein